MDIRDPKFIWGELLARIHAVKERGHPTRPEVAGLVEKALKRQGVPDKAWRYVGERIRDEVPGGDGGRPADRMTQWAEGLTLEIDVGLLEAAFNIQGSKSPRPRALAIVARGTEDREQTTVDTLQRKITRKLRDLPAALEFQYRTSVDFDKIVQEMREGNGLISYEGLRRYAAKWRDPITFAYRGFRVISMPPPSSGGVAIAEILNIMEGYDVRELGFNTPEQIHLVVESFRRAFADRNYYMGDPDFVNIPVERLISDEYARELRSTISRTRATPSASVNRVPVLSEGANTTHYSVVDGAGLAVAVSYTINTDFGSGVVVGGAGFFLNNEMDDFTMRAGHANYYGLVQSDANLVGPGRRPLSSMTPTIVIDSTGALLAVLGSPGGAKIITAVSQVIMNLVDFDMDVRTAVDAPRVHHQLLPDRLRFETDGVDAISLGSLAQMGHDIYPNSGYFGSVQLIVRTPDGVLHGASDPRNKDGRALGY